MNGKQLITALVTISLPFGFGITASAKTHNLKISVNKLTDRSTYISGKTSAKAKVSVTRNGIVYAKGKANSKGLFKLKVSNPLSSDWHYRVTAAKKGYKTISKYVLVSSKSSKQGSKFTQDQIKALNKKIADLQKQISGLNQNPQTVYVNNSTSNGDSGTKDGSDSYDKNKDYWAGTSQNMYVDGPVMLYTDGNSGSDSVDRVFGMTDNIHTIKTWVNNSVEGLYPVEYNGQKLFVDSGEVTNLDADNSSNQLYFKDGSYFANYSPEKSNVRTFNDLHWNEYTPTGIHYWNFRDGSWHDDSNDSNPAPTANQKKIKDLRDQIQAMHKQITTINQNMDQVRTSMNKIDPNENSDIPSLDKLDEYNNDGLDRLDNDLSYWNSIATSDTEKLNELNPNSDEYYVVVSKIKHDNNVIKSINEEISHYNSMTKTITDLGGQAGYLKKAKEYSDQYDSLNSQLSDLTKQRNGLEDQINSLSAQIDTLEKQQDQQ